MLPRMRGLSIGASSIRVLGSTLSAFGWPAPEFCVPQGGKRSAATAFSGRGYGALSPSGYAAVSLTVARQRVMKTRSK